MSGWYRRLWDDGGSLAPGYRILSSLLAPAEWAYGAAVAFRSRAYDSGLIKPEMPALPTLAIGNLTVGGTGKTPITAWLAAHLEGLGRRPAVIMRGYGGDEIDVHRLLNPGVPVFQSPDRAAGVKRARADGADLVLLDDAFQHRRIRAHAYIVLIAAEDWAASPHLLPRGPWREPLSALARADLMVVTRKSATAEEAIGVAERLGELEPRIPRARAHLALSELARYDPPGHSVADRVPLQGFECALAVAGVARPEAVWAQLDELGVKAARHWTFGDHHRYTKKDATLIAEWGKQGPVLATLKDAVKLGPMLGRQVELYVPLQQVVWEAGSPDVQRLIDSL